MSVGGEHESGRQGIAEQPRAAAAAAGSDRPGCSQEAGGGQARLREEERQAASHSYEPEQPAGTSVGGEHESGRQGIAEQPRAAAAAAGSDRPGCSQEAGGGQARLREEERRAASHSYEPEQPAGMSVGGEHESGRQGIAEQPKAAAAAAGSDRPGCSQEAGGGQARLQEEERQAASHSYEPEQPAGTSVGGEHESGRQGIAEQPRAAAAAAGSDRPGCSQEAGGGQAQLREEEGQAVVDEVDEAEEEAQMQMEKVKFDDDVLAGPEEAHSYEPEQPAGTSVERAAEREGINAVLDGQAAVEGSAAHDPDDPFGLDELLPTGRAKKMAASEAPSRSWFSSRCRLYTQVPPILSPLRRLVSPRQLLDRRRPQLRCMGQQARRPCRITGAEGRRIARKDRQQKGLGSTVRPMTRRIRLGMGRRWRGVVGT